MDVTTGTSTSPNVSPTSTNGVGSAFGDTAQEQFSTFLTLLTAQIENQDPLSPLDSTQFVEQLATFSSLEQQVQGNSYLEDISSMLGAFLNSTATDWVGQTVEIESSFVPFNGDDVDFTADIPDTTDNAILKIQGANGDLIYTETLDIADGNWSWKGINNDGNTVQQDLYKISIDLYNDSQYQGSVAPSLITEVAEATIEDGRLKLGLDNNLSAFAENVVKR